MSVKFILLTSTLVIVRARNLNTETIEDHVPVPKYDFSSHELFGRNGEHEVLISNRCKNHDHRDFHDLGSFNVEFNHRQFSHNEKGRDSGSPSHNNGPDLSKSEFHDFVMSTISNRDSNSPHGKKHIERTSYTGSRDSNFGLETFESETKIRDRNIEEAKNVDRRLKSKTFESNYGVQHYNSDFGFGNFEQVFHGNNFGESRSINKRIDHNNNMQKTNFNSNFFKNRPEFNDRNIEERNTKEFGAQIEDNEKYFDTLASSHNQKSHNNNEKRAQGQKNKQNIELITRSIVNNQTSGRIQHKQKTDNEFITTEPPKRRNPSGRDNFEIDQRPIFQTSAKPAVINNTKETNGDVWVWSEGSENKSPATNDTSTESSATTPDLDDRAAFNGDKCPTGSVRVGSICAAVD